MTTTINASTSAGLVQTADTSGILQLQTASTAAVTIDASQNTTLAGTLTTTGITNSGVATATRFNPTGSSVTGNGMYLPAANSLGLSTNGTNAVYIDTSQNVGIGVTPASWASTYRALQIRNLGIMTINDSNWLYSNTYYNGTNNVYTSTGYAGAFDFNGVVTGGYSWRVAASGTAGNTISYTQAMVIDNSGNVGIGTSSPTQKLQVAGNAFISAGQYFMWDNAGAWSWQSDASTYMRAYTSGNERMRIDSSGTVLIGKTAGDDTVTGTKFGNGSGDRVFTVGSSASWGVMVNRQGDDGKAINFRRGNTDVGSINVTSSATSYNTSSDYRLKENIAPMTGALATVAQLKPVTYKWKVDGSDGEGFIAHELAIVKPDCVSGDKDAVDADGKPVYQGIDTSFLVATLTAAIQELKAINDTQAETINALTARIVALEAK